MWASIAFLLGFLLLISVVVRWYLIPAMQAANEATPGERQELSAYSMLLMAVILFVVLSGLILSFRVSRFFFPPPPAHPTKTQYVDAWAESARRLSERADNKADDDA